MTGRYCAKHEEWAPTGECRWCEPGPAEPVKPVMYLGMRVVFDPTPILVSWPSGAKLQQMMNDLWVKMAREDMKP